MPDTLSLPALPAILGARGLCLRPRQAGDQLALDALYQAWRVEQFAPGGLPLADCQQLACQQCRAQRQYYRLLDGRLAWGVLTHHDVCVGRLYLQQRGHDLHVLDLLLQPASRNQGVGSAPLAACRAHAGALGCTQLSLQVELSNVRALLLYQRLGLTLGEINGVHGQMIWPAARCDAPPPASPDGGA